MNDREKRVAAKLKARQIAVKQYGASILNEMENGKPYYTVETKSIYYFTALHYYWKSAEDATRYCKEQVKAGTEARVVKNQYSKQDNTLYTEVVYTR